MLWQITHSGGPWVVAAVERQLPQAGPPKGLDGTGMDRIRKIKGQFSWYKSIGTHAQVMESSRVLQHARLSVSIQEVQIINGEGAKGSSPTMQHS